MNLRFHHIGVACNDINLTAQQYENMGYIRDEIIYDPLQNINICFLQHNEMPLIELLAPVDDQSPVVDTLKKNGVSPYHICYEVTNLEESIKDLRQKKYLVVSKPKQACAINNHRVAFMFHKDMGLIELLEK